MVTTPSVWTNSLNDVCSCMVLQGLRTFTPCDRTQPLDMVAVGMKVMVTLRNPKFRKRTVAPRSRRGNIIDSKLGTHGVIDLSKV